MFVFVRDKRSFQLHMARHGGYEVPAPYKCEECDRVFRNATDLDNHAAMRHRGEKRNICHICGKNFGLRGHVKGHLRVSVVHRIFTVRKRSCGKVMFSQACVKNSVHGGGVSHDALGQTPPPGACWDTHTPGRTSPGRTPPPPPDGHCNGRYASYWNTFLFIIFPEVNCRKKFK